MSRPHNYGPTYSHPLLEKNSTGKDEKQNILVQNRKTVKRNAGNGKRTGLKNKEYFLLFELVSKSPRFTKDENLLRK